MSEAPRAVGGMRRWPGLVVRLLLLVVTGIACYVLAPSLLAVFASFPELRTFRLEWFAAMLVLEAGSFACTWLLLRISIPGLGWFAAATSQLASNAFSRVVPGGVAAGGAIQFRMLVQAGVDPGAAGSALTAVSLITTATVFALPVLVVPTILLGRPVPGGLAAAAWYGALLFAVMVAGGVVLGRSDRAVITLGRALQWVLCRVRPRRPTRDLPERLLAQRNEVRAALGQRWVSAMLSSAGKWGLDYLALLAALAGAGERARPSLILLAYVAASVLAMIPITPGGLGFVEAGLTGTLALAGVPAARAALATLAYRLVSYWLPMLAGLGAWLAFHVQVRGTPRP